MYFVATSSYNSVGTKTINVGFQPAGIRITVGQKTSTSQTFIHLSDGVSDGTTQRVDSVYQDASGSQTIRSNSKIVSHYERVSGTLTEKVAAHIDTSTAPWTSTDVAFIVDTADVGYQFRIEVWG